MSDGTRSVGGSSRLHRSGTWWLARPVGVSTAVAVTGVRVLAVGSSRGAS